jgi:hypothetical protein
VAQRFLPPLVVAILLGLLGMHALNLPDSSPESGHAAHSHLGQTATDAVDDTPVGTAVDSPVLEAGAGIGGLAILCCGAMLVVVLALVWLVGRFRRGTLSGPGPLRLLTDFVGSHATRHGQGPPYVWDFSVTRC